MKFAFSTLACPQWSLEQIVEHARQYGYNGIELRLLDGEVLDPVKDAGKIRHAVTYCREHGLEVCALDTSCRFNISNVQERTRQIEDARRWIELAQEVQVSVLRTFGGYSPADEPQPTEQEEDERIIEALRQLAPLAEQASVRIAQETHDAFSSARRVASILQAVNSEAVTALWDSHHTYRVGESVEDVLTALDRRISHVHVKDARRLAGEQGDQWRLVLLGAGEVPVREMLSALKRYGYDGYISIEWEKKWHPQIEEPEVALPQGIAWLRREAV
ncbi:MAG: sugar phosphate isomerase/epimerase [Ktedonobacteraceae bacterium]|nr:sugar phosphate isomerase/epimerase [Ktedonobacteraceae bacterium]